MGMGDWEVRWLGEGGFETPLSQPPLIPRGRMYFSHWGGCIYNEEEKDTVGTPYMMHVH